MDAIVLSSIRFQLASLCFMAVVIFDYVRSEKPKISTTKFFTVMLTSATLYLMTDIATVFTLFYHKESLINRITHQAFIILLITTIFLTALYVEILGNGDLRRVNKPALAAISVPYFVAVGFALFGDINFVLDENGLYSYGNMVSALYSAIAFYIIEMFIETFRYKNKISPKKRTALRLQFLIWGVIAIVQFFNQYMLLSGLGIALTFISLYFSFENPNENIDDITGAFNKRAFIQVFKGNINRSSKPFHVVALVVDDWDVVISSIGHHHSDALAHNLTKFMEGLFSDDEYRMEPNAVAVMTYLSMDEINKKIAVLEERMSAGWHINDNCIKMKSHVVLLECPTVTCSAIEATELIMFDAMETGTGFVRTIDSSVTEKKQRKDVLTKMLADAIENDGFEVVYQPIYSSADKAFVSSEALVRLKDKETLGFVSPEEFIPLAEKNGYITKIGEIVFEKVCSVIDRVHKEGLPLKYIEVNLSALQSIDETVPPAFDAIMKKYGVAPECLNLEITETTAVESEKLLERNMKAFREMGCSFSMDDFGTGYSNLSKMADIHYDLIKIDKSLIWPCYEENPNPKAEAVLGTVIKLVRDLGTHLVAEGVETEEMANGLIEAGVHYLQGYYYSRPIPEEAYVEFIREHA
ncbi:MAG: EAL domain-containing protein [Ruminococcus sp.]|nr:EAL domain-containing protein [Ruminococcus sp.]